MMLQNCASIFNCNEPLIAFCTSFQGGEKLGYETEAFAIYDVMRSLMFSFHKYVIIHLL